MTSPSFIDNQLPDPLMDQLVALGWKKDRPLSPLSGNPVIVWIINEIKYTFNLKLQKMPSGKIPEINPWIDLIENLLPYLTHPHQPGDDGRTPLHIAHFSARLTQILLDAKAPLEAEDIYGSTPLLHTIHENTEEAKEVFEILLKAGANPHATSELGSTLHSSAHYGSLYFVERLLELGVDPNIRARSHERELPLMSANFEGKSQEAIYRLINAGSRVDIVTENGNSALMRAIMTQADTNMIQRLIDEGACVRKQARQHPSPIVNAARWNPKVLKTLLDNGADAQETHPAMHQGGISVEDAIKAMASDELIKPTPYQDNMFEENLILLLKAGGKTRRLKSFLDHAEKTKLKPTETVDKMRARVRHIETMVSLEKSISCESPISGQSPARPRL